MMPTPSWRVGGAVLLAIALLLFATSLLLTERRVAQLTETVVVTNSEAGWGLFQARFELERLLDALEIAEAGRLDEARLRLRADLFGSWVDILTAGRDAGAVRALDGAVELLDRLAAILDRHAAALAAGADAATVTALRRELEPARGELQDLTLAFVHHSAEAHSLLRERVRELRTASALALGGLLLSTGILIFLLLREVGNTRRLLQRTEEARARIEHLAHHDFLTSLPNRRLFEDRLEQALALARRTRARLALHYFDLDRFKEVNDALGHRAGDELLRGLADRLRPLLRGADTLARLGGDEFAVLQTDLKVPTDAAALAERLMTAAGAPFAAAGKEVATSISVGIALFPADGEVADELRAHADMALYSAKEEGGGRLAFFSPELTEQTRSRRALSRELGHGIAGGELELHYQPKVAAADGVVTGLEALVRWRHPERGTLSPGLFVPLAEETGLIEPLGAWVITDACRQIGRWRAGGIVPPRVAINLSPSQLRHGTVARRLSELIRSLAIPAELIELELTESVLLDDDPRVHRELEDLIRLGVTIALDDFGTGYSSLSYLHRLRLHTLKIDRSLVASFGDGRAETICSHVVRLAHDLGMVVVAEGIETEAHVEIAREVGFDELQGYWFAPPTPAAEIAGRLRLPGPFRASGEMLRRFL
ncbi:MAG: EAL domain-containing protein [Geminicoccaceae bacterium]